MAYEAEFPWHAGESHMHKLLRVPEDENPTTPYLALYASHILMRCPILAVGTLDAQRRPWTSLWGGEPGFTRAIGQSIIGVKAHVDRKHDPVIQALLGGQADGEVVQEKGPGRMISALGIDLETRSRVKLYGRMAAGALAATEGDAGKAQLVVKIEQSLGNCPKYLNKKHITPHQPTPKLISDSLPLPQNAINLLAKADNFYISSSNHDSDMDTNHRGGPSGFVRLESNSSESCTIIYPEYSGNRLYQTLGNLVTTPLAGLVFPDYETGDVLYITGTTEILVREAAAAILPRTNMAVRIHITAARYVASGLSFRGTVLDYSPYNPPLRFLQEEVIHSLPKTAKNITARLTDKKIITPNVGRFKFSIDDPSGSNLKASSSATTWRPGQYVALDFSEELDIGYSHMRDDDPKSLNDDFLRTFTVSSNPLFPSSTSPSPFHLQKPDFSTFDITIRRLGPVTNFLFKQNIRSGLSVPLKGFGGDFIFYQGRHVEQESSSEESNRLPGPKEVIGVVAGGIGITPLLAQVPDLDLSRVRLFWTLRAEDLNLVLDTLERFPGLVAPTRLFITGYSQSSNAKSGALHDEIEKMMGRLDNMGVSMHTRRIERADLDVSGGGETAEADEQQQEETSGNSQIKTWYVCAGLGLKKMVEEWLYGRTVISERFDY